MALLLIETTILKPYLVKKIQKLKVYGNICILY